MKQNDTIESTNKLLRVMIALLVRKGEQGILNLREQISILYNLSLEPKEIAGILGRTNLYVNKELSELRKLKRKKVNHD